ncbi:hypothetical protein FJY84_02870 [Candidatus Bathyarchaeota archaeon]|nr:hypothetical protein [Candidatus Bathyarchaeota archaeon]
MQLSNYTVHPDVSKNDHRNFKESNPNYQEIFQYLSNYKLNNKEIKIFLYLSQLGPKKVYEINQSLNIQRSEVYILLKNLEEKGLICRTLEKPYKFCAIEIEKALDNMISEEKINIKNMEFTKENILEVWDNIPKIFVDDNKAEKIQILEGKKRIITKLFEFLERTGSEYKILMADKDLIWLFNHQLFEKIEEKNKKNKLEIKLITNDTINSRFIIDKINTRVISCTYLNELKLNGFVVSDNDLLILLNDDSSGLNALWTNHNSLIKTHNILFEKMYKEF